MALSPAGNAGAAQAEQQMAPQNTRNDRPEAGYGAGAPQNQQMTAPRQEVSESSAQSAPPPERTQRMEAPAAPPPAANDPTGQKGRQIDMIA
jgi:hypothetical protein